jgi:hypothetical protein
MPHVPIVSERIATRSCALSHSAKLPRARANRWPCCLWLLAAFGAAWLLGAAPIAAQVISTPTRASIYGGWQCEPDLAIDGDHVVAVWSDGSNAPFAGWGYSTDGGRSWAEGDRFFARNGLETVLRHGSIAVNPTANYYAVVGYYSFYAGLALYRGRFQGETFRWDSLSVIPLEPTGAFLDMIYDTPSLACTAEPGMLYLACARAYRDTSTIIFLRSVDDGRTWSAPIKLSGPKSNGTELVIGPDGEVYVFWEDFAAGSIVGRKSLDQGVSFGPQFVVAPIYDDYFAPTGMTPDGRSNPAYYHGASLAASFPSIAVDRSNGPRRGWLYATWAEHSNAPAAPTSRSIGEREPNDYWAAATPIQIGDWVGGGTVGKLSGGFLDVDLFTFEAVQGTQVRIDSRMTNLGGPNRDSYINWYCGSDTTQLTRLGLVEMFNSRVHSGPSVFYTLPQAGRYYLEINGIDPYSSEYDFQLRLVEPHPSGPSRDHRDVVIVHSEDGGVTWSAKTRVNDDPPGNDNALPGVSVDELGTVHVAWYDRRDHPGCDPLVQTYWTSSTDGANTFLPSLALSTQSSRWHGYMGFSPGANIGDHLAVTSRGGRTYVLWTEIDHPDFDIYGVTIEDRTVVTQIPQLQGNVIDGRITLEWWIAPSEFASYRLYRGAHGSTRLDPLQSTPVPLHGPGQYREVDATVELGHSYTYRLELLRKAGEPVWSNAVDLTAASATSRLVMDPPSPNPFSVRTAFDLELPRPGRLTVKVHDTTGRCVADVFSGQAVTGRKRIEWNGRLLDGKSAPPGAYILWVRLDTETRSMRIFKIE